MRKQSGRHGKIVVLVVLALATFSASTVTPEATPRPQTDPRFEELASLVNEKMEDYGVTGVAFGVSKDGVVMLRGFGVTNLEDPQPITPDTIFPIASISKTIATTALMKLAEGGRMDLNEQWRRSTRCSEIRSTSSETRMVWSAGCDGAAGSRERISGH